MEKYMILADVTCDLSKEIREEIGMVDYVHGHVNFSDGRDFKTSLDWDTISKEDFYKALSNRKIKISTAPSSPDEYVQYFEKYVQEGYKILSISISSKISSTYNVATKAAEMVKEKYPDCEIYCLDSLRMSAASGLLVIYAHMLKKEGMSYQELINWLENNKRRVHQMGPIDDLMFVARRGRISTGKAIMGSFAGVKPMGDCNADGYVTVLGKGKGIKKALEYTVRYVEAVAEDPQNEYFIIANTDREQYALELKKMIEERIGPKKVFFTDVFDGCAPNVGPGMVGVYFLGAAISEDLAAEKAAMTKILEG